MDNIYKISGVTRKIKTIRSYMLGVKGVVIWSKFIRVIRVDYQNIITNFIVI